MIRRLAILAAVLALAGPVQAQQLTGGCIILGTTSVCLGATATTVTGLTLSGGTLSGTTTLPGSGQITSAGRLSVNAAATTDALIGTSGAVSAAFWGNGLLLQIGGSTLTDTSSSGAVAAIASSNVGGSTLAASSATTYGRASTLRVGLAPLQGSNVTITDALSFESAGAGYFAGNLRIGGITGGTNNGNILLTLGDRFPVIAFRTATTIAAQLVSDVTVGSYFLDAPGGIAIRDAINGGNTRLSVAVTTGNILFGAGFTQWAGATSAFPALKRSSTALQVRLADDSNYAPFAASGYSAGAVAGVSCGAGTVNPVTTVVTGGIITTC